MLMKRSETNVCFGLLSMRCQNDLKNMTKYGIIYLYRGGFNGEIGYEKSKFRSKTKGG